MTDCSILRKIAALIAFACLVCCGALPAFADQLDDDLASQWTTRDLPAQAGTPVVSAARRFELALNIGYVPTDDYYNYFPIALDIHGRITDMWGVMLRGSLLMLHADTTLRRFMDSHQNAITTALLADEQLGDVTVMATFHPVYGKATVETSNLLHFDWGIFAGLGAVIARSPNSTHTETAVAAYAEGIFGTDMHIFFLDWLALRLEASLRFYKGSTQWYVPCTLSVGVSFFLPEF
ncbi:MAG: hypothetical protein IKY83_09635 [Proteobacteria bacterium]|nr:hypothetical protein [Pseudomonadota bacterium]